MYEEYYGLTEKPFNLTPDPRFLYLSKKHKEAFAHLMYGIRHRSGFVMVSGEIGTGKTTICRSLLKQLDPDIEVALIFNPYLSPQELLKCINKDFGLESDSSSILELIDELNVYLLARASEGKNCVLIIDEAQDLSAEILEQIRLLSNLETEKEKLLQIMLIGQPELAQKLELNELRQLNQRITARYHLEALSEDETLHYVAFRLRVAGGRKRVRFTRKAIRAIYRISQGTPRVINALCDRALLIGYTRELHEITPKIVKLAAKEIHGNEHVQVRRLDIGSILRTTGFLTSAAVIVLVIVLLTSGPFPFPRISWDTGTTPVAVVPSIERPLNAASQVEAIETVPEVSDPTEALTQLEAELVETVEAVHEDMEVASSPKPEIVTPLEPEQDLGSELVSSETLKESAESEITPSVEKEPEIEIPTEKIVVASIPKVLQDTEMKPADTVRMSAKLQQEALHSALSGLLKAWGVTAVTEYPATTRYSEIVEFSVAHGFGLNRLESTLEQLIALNYPALLKADFGEGSHWVALLNTDGVDVTIASKSDEARVMPLSALKDAYRDSAVVLWLDTYTFREPLRAMDQGEPIWELQYDLVKLGMLKSEPNGVYDSYTVEAVSRIQKACGILVDGVFGAQTRMVVAGWLSENPGPHLTAEAFPTAVLKSMVAKGLSVPEMAAEEPVVADEPPVVETVEVIADEPLLPARNAPSSDSVTEPAGSIVPLVPSHSADEEGKE